MILIGLPLLALFVISLGGYLASEIIKCLYNKQFVQNATETYKYTAIVSAISALVLILLSGAEFPSSPFSLLLGLLFGAAIMAHLCASSLAIQIGPWSYTTVTISLAIVIPAFSGAIFWGEPLSWLDFVGLAFMIACLVMSVQKNVENEEAKKASLKWLLLCILAMVCMAGIGLLQKTHQTSLHRSEITVFLISAFIFSSVSASLIYLFSKHRRNEKHDPPKKAQQKNKIATVLMLTMGAGLATALNHVINLYLSGAIDSVVFFPVMCGCELIGIALASLLLFKERLTKRQWLGFSCGAVAILLLCI